MNRIKTSATPRRLVKVGLVLLLVGVAWVSLAHPAFSQNAPQQPGAPQHGGGNVVQKGSSNAATNLGTREWWIGLFASMLLYVAVLFIKVTLFALTFIIELSAYNGYLDATAVNVGWVMVRDITNMAFVVILLIIAFGTILGLEQYEWKKLLVKFVLAAILVNFSRLICGLLIDVSQLIMITFVNGIAATAGGNLINAFNLDRIVKIYSPPSVPELAAPGIFTAAVAAVVFAGMAMAVMFIFVFILLARLLGLWILIVLSPLAFVLSVIPKTQSFASRWWTEFGDRLVTGPVLLFFIWLSFVTVGTGDALGRDIDPYVDVPNKITPDGALEADKVGGQTLGIGDAMGWNKVANFAIAIGMLIAGAKVASEIGGSSGSALSGVASFGKKVATIASGYAVGRWLYGKGAGAVGAAVGAGAKAGKFVLMDILPVRHYGQMVSRSGQRQWQSFEAWRNLTPGKRPKQEWNERAERWEVKKDAQGKIEYEDVKPKFALVHGFFQKRVMERAGSMKKLEKTEKFAKIRDESLKKDIRGVPTGFFMADWEKVDGIDRFEQGLLDLKQARSDAKTKDIKAQATAMYGQERRRQFDIDKGEWREAGRGATMQEEIERHNLNARTHEAQMQKIQAEAKLRVAMDTKAGQGLEQLRAIAAAQEAAAAKEAALKAREAETKFEVLKKPETEALIKERTEEEKRAHIMATEEEAVRKKAAAEFYRGTEGARELKRAAEVEREVKYYATEEERRKAEAAKVAAVSPFVKKAEEEALLKAAAEKETKEKEEAARREAVTAAGVPGGALERAARAEVRLAAEAARIKEEEEKAKADAAASEKVALQQAKKAEVRTAVPEAERKRLEEAATVAARAKEDVALKEAKRIDISRALEEARKKTQEETAKAAAASGMPLVLEMTKAEEFKAAEQTAITKEKEESAKEAAAKKEEATIRQTKEAEIRAAAKTAEEKVIEERAKAEAMRRQKPAVEATEAAKVRMGEKTAEVGALEAKAATAAIKSLPDVVKRSQIAEADKKAATDVATRLKDESLTEAYAAAHAAIEALFERVELDPAAVEAGIEELANRDAFVNSKIRAKQLAETGRDKTVAEGQFDEASYDAVVSVPRRGIRTPQTTIARAIEQVKSDLKLDAMERTEGQTAVATMIANLFSKGDLKRSDKLALSAVIGAIDVEAWNDDVFDQIFDMLKSLTDGRELTVPQRKRAEGMKRFADSMGWKTEDKVQTKEGREELKQTIKISYGRRMSAQLQNIAGTGADRMLVRGATEIDKIVQEEVEAKVAELNGDRGHREDAAHAEIMANRLPEVIKSVVGQERYAAILATKAPGETVDMADVRIPEESDKISRTISDMVFRSVGNAEKKIIDQIALGQGFTSLLGKMAGKADLTEFWDEVLPGVSDVEARKKAFMSRLKAAQSLYTPATRNFTKNAYQTKHYESAHNSQYDPTIGMQRPQNFYEAERETTVDMSKMTIPTLAPAQIHSMIDMDMNSHLPKKILESMYRAIFGQINEEYQLNQVNPRTVKKLFGYDPDEVAQKANGYAILGGSTMDKTENAGAAGTEERGRHLIRDILVPQIMGGHRAFLINLKNLFGHVSSDEMNSGVIKTNIDGFGTAKKLSDLIAIIRKDSALSADIGQIQIKKLERLVADVENDGAGIGKKGTPREAREAA